MNNSRMRYSLALLAIILAFNTSAQAAANAPHVVLVSIDGFRPEIYLEAERIGIKTPNLRKIMAKGTYAKRMRGVFPTLTYPSHTSLVTGVAPARHGVISNKTSDGAWRMNARSITATTLWQAAKHRGLTTASVAWPVTVGAEIDFLIPENPSSGEPTLTGALRLGATPGLFEKLEAELGPIDLPAYNAPGAVGELDAAIAAMAAQILKDEKPNLLLVHFLQADEEQHAAGTNSAQAGHAFETIDGHIGALLKAITQAGISQSTTIIIVGDHGFANIHTRISVTDLMSAAGLMGNTEDASTKLTIYAAGGAAALYPSESPNKALEKRAPDVMASYINRHHADYLHFYGPDELTKQGGFPGAIFALTASKGYAFTKNSGKGIFSASAQKGTHGYAPDMPEMATGFLIQGPGVFQNKSLEMIEMTSVAPLIAKILNLQLDVAELSTVADDIFTLVRK